MDTKQNIFHFQHVARTSYLLAVLMIASMVCLHAQGNDNSYPAVGQACPDFVLNDVKYYPKKNVTLNDFKGKWLVLDFFTTGCTSCFASLPKIDSMNIRYRDQVQFMMVGKTDKYIEGAYEKFRKRFNLTLPISYDSSIFTRFGIYGVPNYMFIDKEGIVRAITNTINKGMLEDVLSGRSAGLLTEKNAAERSQISTMYDSKKPLLLNGNGGSDTSFLYRSVLTTWKGEIYAFHSDYISSRNKNRIQLIGLPVRDLYYIAFGDTVEIHPPARVHSYGKLWWRPILEMQDTTDFITKNYTTLNLYDYSLYVPKAKGKTLHLKAVMQYDLRSYFGYDARVEKRLMPYWKVVVVDSKKVEKLRTKGGEKCGNGKEYLPSTGFSFRNCPTSALINHLHSYFQQGRPFIDETNIDFNVDMDVDALRSDFQGIRSSLQKLGLDIVEGTKEMSVIVIRDMNQSP